eukprot:2782441-Ditylum_brightwellii.AAC.1
MNKIYTILALDECDDGDNKLTSDNDVLKNEMDDAAHYIITLIICNKLLKEKLVCKLCMEERKKIIIEI